MKKVVIISSIIILLSFIIGIYLYPQMGDKMASHWNAKGEVDDYMSKFWGLFLMPLISILLLLLFIIIPRIDPLKENIEKFRKYYNTFVIIIIAFLFYIYLVTILWSLGYRFNMNQVLPPIIAVIFYYSGVLMNKAKRNWFIGIRTPWTLSSDRVWDKTNKLGGKLFKVVAVLALAGIFFEDYAIYIFIIPALLVAGYVTVYSYFEYQKEK